VPPHARCLELLRSCRPKVSWLPAACVRHAACGDGERMDPHKRRTDEKLAGSGTVAALPMAADRGASHYPHSRPQSAATRSGAELQGQRPSRRVHKALGFQQPYLRWGAAAPVSAVLLNSGQHHWAQMHHGGNATQLCNDPQQVWGSHFYNLGRVSNSCGSQGLTWASRQQLGLLQHHTQSCILVAGAVTAGGQARV
jgi:hypothetical protein